jgi:hypothetical protein
MKLLAKLDSIESNGNFRVRKQRKSLAKEIELELGCLDRKKEEAWEVQRVAIQLQPGNPPSDIKITGLTDEPLTPTIMTHDEMELDGETPCDPCDDITVVDDEVTLSDDEGEHKAFMESLNSLDSKHPPQHSDSTPDELLVEPSTSLASTSDDEISSEADWESVLAQIEGSPTETYPPELTSTTAQNEGDFIVVDSDSLQPQVKVGELVEAGDKVEVEVV